MHAHGVGAGHDWCRMWWSHGAWRIGHHAWTHADPELAVAYVPSGAALPGEIGCGGDAQNEWREHTGTRCGHDYGKAEGQFKRSKGVHVTNPHPKRSAGGSGASEVVVGAAIGDADADTPVVIARAVPVASSAAGTPPLLTLLELFKRELGVKGTSAHEAVGAAVAELGLEAEVGGLPLIQKAHMCWEALGRPS